MLYVVTCFMKLQRADSSGILADSLAHHHSAVFPRGHCEVGWLSYRLNGTAGKYKM